MNACMNVKERKGKQQQQWSIFPSFFFFLPFLHFLRSSSSFCGSRRCLLACLFSFSCLFPVLHSINSLPHTASHHDLDLGPLLFHPHPSKKHTTASLHRYSSHVIIIMYMFILLLLLLFIDPPLLPSWSFSLLCFRSSQTVDVLVKPLD